MKARIFISLTFVFFLSQLQAAPKPPAVTTPPPKPVPGGGGGGPSAPAVYPTFPIKVGTGHSGGDPEEPHVVIVPSPPSVEIKHPVIHNDTLVKAPPADTSPGLLVRPSLFITRNETVHRTSPFSEPVPRDREIPITPQSLSNETDLREALIDATVAEHEYENDLAMIEINTRFHVQQTALYKKQVTPKQTFRESEARLIKSRFKADESKGRWMSFNAEVDLMRLKAAQSSHVKVSLLDIAEGYAKLWESRLVRVKGSEGIAQADYDYHKDVLDMVRALKHATATSEQAVIEAERDAGQSMIVLKLAHKVVSQTTEFYQESLDAVEKVKHSRSDEAN